MQIKYLTNNIIIASCIFFLLTSACSKKTDDTKKAIATVNGEKIFVHDLDEEIKGFVRKFEPGRLPRGIKSGNLHKSLLSKVIEKKLLLQEAEKLNISISDKELEEKINNITGDYPPLRLREVLESKDMTFDDWKKGLHERFLIEKLINKEVYSKITVSEPDMKKYYVANKEEFLQPLQVHALQIFVETESDAKAIKEELEKGSDFSDLAITKSLTPDGKKGGDLGFFSKGQMPKEFDDVVFNLRIGGLSDVIQTPYGFHIFKVVEKREAKQIEFDEAKAKIMKKILQERQKEVSFIWLKELKTNATIVLKGQKEQMKDKK